MKEEHGFYVNKDGLKYNHVDCAECEQMRQVVVTDGVRRNLERVWGGLG